MNGRAALGNYPLHPALVAIPLGAFVMTALCDLSYWRTLDVFWYDFARLTLLVGLVAALVAAVAGVVDLLSVDMNVRGRRLANLLMACNLAILGLYGASLALRWNRGAVIASTSEGGGSWPLAAGLAFVALGFAGVSAWLAHEMCREYKLAGGKGGREVAAGAIRGSRAAVLIWFGLLGAVAVMVACGRVAV